MKTAEEILFTKYPNHKYFEGTELGKSTKRKMIEAMEEYAAQFQKDDRAAKTAIEFAEWLRQNLWESAGLGTEKWVRNKIAGKLGWEWGLTTELYTLWQQSLPPESDQVNT
jgi:hypothetical protein